MDPFAIYDDHYKELREAMSDAVCGDQIDALTEATQVHSQSRRLHAAFFDYVPFSFHIIVYSSLSHNNYTIIQTLKSSEVPYVILALYEKATLTRTTDSKMSDDVSKFLQLIF